MIPVKTIKVWADTVTHGTRGTCRSKRCRASIWFAKTVGRGKMIPFDGKRSPEFTSEEYGTRRQIWHVAESQVHFINCPGATAHRKRTPSRPAPPVTPSLFS